MERRLLGASVVFLVASLTPYSLQGMRSDGLVLWQLWRKPQFNRRLMSFLTLRATEMKGVRPRDFDPELMREALDTTEAEAFYILFNFTRGIGVWIKGMRRGPWSIWRNSSSPRAVAGARR